MHVEQISVFLENKTGRLSEVTAILSEAGINIRALSLADTSDFGVLRLIVDNIVLANDVLKENGLTVGKTEVVAAEVDDRPGGLNAILEVLMAASINVEYMYAFVKHASQDAVMIFRFDDVDAAVDVLNTNGIKVIDGEQLYTM